MKSIVPMLLQVLITTVSIAQVGGGNAPPNATLRLDSNSLYCGAKIHLAADDAVLAEDSRNAPPDRRIASALAELPAAPNTPVTSAWCMSFLAVNDKLASEEDSGGTVRLRSSGAGAMKAGVYGNE